MAKDSGGLTISAPAPMDRKYVVKHEMLSASRLRPDGTRDTIDGGYREGETVLPSQLGVDLDGLERLINIGAVEPLITLVPQYQ